MGTYEVLNLSDFTKWNKYLQRLPIGQCDIYFTPGYYQIYEELGDGKAKCFIYTEDNSLAVYPFLLNSVNECGYHLSKEYFDIQGAYGYNGVLSNNYSYGFRIRFHDTFSEYCKDNDIIAEFTRFHTLLNNSKFSNEFMTITKLRNTVFLDLTDSYESIFTTSYSPQNKNKIRKAHKNQFAIEINENPSIKKIRSFIDLYQKTMKVVKADKYFLFNEEYFFNIFKKITSSAVLFEVINNENEIECAAIILVYGNFAHYHLSGRRKESDNSVNNFVLDESIKYAINQGAKTFHLGGGTTSGDDDPLLKFKSNFSKEKLNFQIGWKIHNEDIYNDVVQQWRINYPEKREKHKNIFLKYRF